MLALAAILSSSLAAANTDESARGIEFLERCDAAMDFALLQHNAAVNIEPETESKPVFEVLPELMPLARSLTSEDPEAAAEHMVRYYGARRVAATNLSSPCVHTVGVEFSRADGVSETHLDRYTLYFVKDAQKWAGPRPRDFFEGLSDNAFQTMIKTGKNASWQGWMDFHDGLTPTLNPYGMNLTNLRKDKIPVQVFHGKSAFDGAWGIGLRFNIPNTTRTLEVDGIDTQLMNVLSSEDQAYLREQQALPVAFGCRNLSVKVQDDDALATLWKKSTYFVERKYQQQAYEFAVAALGLEKLDSPYPLPPDPDCTSALWSRFPGPAKYFQFHFVSTPSWPDYDASSYHKYQGEERSLEAGCFDHHLYNSLILWAESLDPFVRRLQQLDTPFLTLKLQDVFSVVFSFPMAPAITIDIRSSTLSVLEPANFDPCEQTRCGARSA